MIDKLKQFIRPISLAFIVGILADKISTLDKADPTTSDFAIGFFVIVPITVLLLLLVFKTFKLKNKAVIITATALVFILSGVFGFWFYEFRIGYVSDMYFVLYILGIVPSIITGLLFGIYLARQINKPQL